MRPVPWPVLSPQLWPGVLFIGECASGWGNVWHLQDSRTHLPLAMQIEISPSPSATVQGVKIAAEVTMKMVLVIMRCKPKISFQQELGSKVMAQNAGVRMHMHQRRSEAILKCEKFPQ